MARYLVTGGAGFIGSNLVLALARAGERVRVVDDLSTGFWKNLELCGPQVERITADIRDPSQMARACANVEVVFHQAALGSVPRSIEHPVLCDGVNSGGTVTLLDAARHAGVRRLIFAASSAVYGDSETLPKREDMPSSPLSPYAVSKLSAEHYLRVFSALYGLETLSLRYFNVFGPRQRPDGAYAAAIPAFIWAALRGRPITINGDGETTRDFCFVDNAVSANLLAATAAAKLTGQVTNVAAGQSTTLNELVACIGSVLGRKLDVQYGPPRPGDVRHSLADLARARELFGYEPLVSWQEGLAPTVQYLEQLARERGAACGA